MEEIQQVLIILGLLLSPLYLMLAIITKRLNRTCGTVTKINTFLKMIHKKEAKGVLE